jgi:hypothetical protein
MNVSGILFGEPDGKRPLGRSRRRWEGNIKMSLREIELDDADEIYLAHICTCDEFLWVL